MASYGKGQKAATLTLTATTTGAGETVTIHRMTPAAGKSLTIAWGDGNTTVVAAGDTAAKSNVYAAAGTYSVVVTSATDIVQVDLHDSKLSGLSSLELAASAITHFVCYLLGAATPSVIDSSHMSGWTPTNWYLHSMPAGTYSIDSSHMSGWTPTNWRLNSMPAGTYSIDSSHMSGWTAAWWRLNSMPAGTYSIDSSHMSGWTPTNWYLSSMPAGTYSIDSSHMSGWTPTWWRLYSMPAGTYSIDSSHMSGWTPTNWQLYSMPAGTYSIDSSHMSGWTPTNWYLYSINGGGAGWTLTAADFAGWVSAINVLIQDNALLQAQVNAVLYGMYQATLSRTATGGDINVGGTNAAPSGVYQAAAACPVDAATPGKEVAHELLNDGCGAIAAGETWTTVTFTP